MIYLLLVLFEIKHFVCDYPLQTSFMLKKAQKNGWALPLALHCAVHGSFAFLISIFFTTVNVALLIFILDFVIHFAMDRVKASPNMLGKYHISEAKFWSALGFDQAVHHLTNFLLIWIILE